MLPIVDGDPRGLQSKLFHEGNMTLGAKICFWRKINKLNSIKVPKTKMTQKTIQISSLEEYDTLGVVVAIALNMAAKVSNAVMPVKTRLSSSKRELNS